MTSRRVPRFHIRWAVAVGAVLVIAGQAPVSGAVVTATTGIDVRLPLGHQIRGVVTDPDGGPLVGAQVSATSDSTLQSAVTRSDGSYVIHGVPDGDFRVQAGTDGDIFLTAYYGTPDSTPDFNQAAIVTVDGADVTGIDVRLFAPAATGISGTIRDPEGHPVAGIELTANGPVGSLATTGPNGEYRLPRLPAGEYTIFVQPPNGSDFLFGPYVDGAVGGPEDDATIITVGDSDVAGIDMVLTRGGSITGHVTTARPAAIEVEASGPTSGSALVDGSGNFTIRGLGSGSYQVFVRDAIPGPEQTETGNFGYGWYGAGTALVDFAHAASIDVSTSTTTLRPISIPRGTDIVGRVTDGKNGLAGAFVTVCDVSGALGCGFATGDADGRFRILHVPTGKFTIEAAAPGRVGGFYRPNGFTIDDFGAGTVSVVSGKPDVKGIEVALPAGGSIAGRITGPTGEPVANVTVSVFPFGVGPGAPLPKTDSTGRFRQTGIPTNVYGVSVNVPQDLDYLSGYYVSGAPGNYGIDGSSATMLRVIEARDGEAPFITFRDPAPGAVDVVPDAALSVRFSEPVEGVTTSSVTLRDDRGQSVAAAVSFDAQARTATIQPNEPLQAGGRYRLVLTSAIRDWSGNRLAAISWTFTTAS